jgi:transposase-like protein
MPQRFQRPYPPEFRREAVSLVKVSGRSMREVAGELGVSYEGHVPSSGVRVERAILA